ncbi:MAG: flagellar biosynthesis/type III secretory pathway chaperone [Bermanella sp.]|jgi:flagellar biosynthesis/type III secretory pathway chaperone
MQETSEIVDLTRDIITAIRQFESLLHEEASALELITRDGLIEIAERKTRYADHLDNLVKRRAKLLHALGVQDGNERDLVNVLNNGDQGRQITRDWTEAVRRLRECKLLNDIAGATIQAQTRYMRRGLEIINGSPAKNSYGPAGDFVGEQAYAKELGTA